MAFMDYDLNKVVSETHSLRKIKEKINFESLAYRIKDCVSEKGRNGYGLEVALKSLFLQFYHDLSDRQMEEQMRDSIAFRWFCDFKFDDITPDHTYFCRMRTIIGTKRIGKIFNYLNKKAENAGVIGKLFNFVDATTIKAKETTWVERDKAIKDGEDKINNENISNYSSDKDARFGCKGKNKFWFGYKRHVSADMKEGIILKVAVTPANIPDHMGLKHICPKSVMVFGDKAYGVGAGQTIMKANYCHSGAILKNNMKNKNRDKDRWLTKVRMPFENIFSKNKKRARYRGIEKIQLQAFFEAMIHNIKRLVAIDSPPLFQTA